MKLASLVRLVVTVLVVLLAVLIGHALWKHYMYSPWTRDGRVRAEVVRIAPDVAGLVTDVKVVDNQVVKKGDLLFVIDRARYLNAVAQAEANLAAAEAAARAAGASINAASAGANQSKVNYDNYAAQSERRQKLINNVISAEDRANAQAAAKPGTLKQAQALADAGALPEAADIARTYLKAHPASAAAYYLLGVIADAQGARSEARGFYKRALYLDPGHGEALTHLAAVLGLEGDHAGSRLLLARAERASGGRRE